MIPTEKKLTYATLTNDQKEWIDHEYSWSVRFGKSDACHIAACIAHAYMMNVDNKSQRAESEAFSAVLTYLVWQKKVKVN